MCSARRHRYLSYSQPFFPIFSLLVLVSRNQRTGQCLRLDSSGASSPLQPPRPSSQPKNDGGMPPSPRQIVSKYLLAMEDGSGDRRELTPNRGPLARTVILAPPSAWPASSDVDGGRLSYVQSATSSKIVGAAEVLASAASFDEGFQSPDSSSSSESSSSALFAFDDDDVSSSIGRVSSTSTEVVTVSWNVTWTPPTAWWLRAVGEAWPGGVEVEPTPYNHMSSTVSSFSWGAVWRMFECAARTGRLPVPLACIEGRSTLRFRGRSTTTTAATAGGRDEEVLDDGVETAGSENLNWRHDEAWELTSILEDLSYADDLRRGRLLNRRCASDLRLFLECGRRPPAVPWDEWRNDVVARCLPWESVPGSGPLDVEPVAEEEGNLPATLVFLALTAVAILVFANAVGPELVGQSLFGPPNFAVDPSQLRTIS